MSKGGVEIKCGAKDEMGKQPNKRWQIKRYRKTGKTTKYKETVNGMDFKDWQPKNYDNIFYD